MDICFYDEQFVPLLHRMLNVEELLLNISIGRYTFFDGNHLKNDIINHMTKLNKFVFSIHSVIPHVTDSSHLPSNENIEHTFKDLDDYQIISYIDYFPKDKIGQCHIYSKPYTINYFYRLTNSFSGGFFQFVHKVSLIDEHPFEHEFFIRIAQAFPFLQTLIIDNQTPQNHKQSNEHHRNLTIIEYPHLTHLNLTANHDDYIEHFLDDTKVCLSTYITLFIDYHCLQRVTHNFTRATTRNNCAKVKYLFGNEKINVPKHFHLYFPHVKRL
jgi:hypothetical protein